MKTRIVLEESFYFLSVALIIFFAMELFWPRIVQAYLNLSWLALVWIILGVILLIFPKEK